MAAIETPLALVDAKSSRDHPPVIDALLRADAGAGAVRAGFSHLMVESQGCEHGSRALVFGEDVDHLRGVVARALL